MTHNVSDGVVMAVDVGQSWLNRREDAPRLPPTAMERLLRESSSGLNVEMIVFGDETAGKMPANLRRIT